jgi:hypothetical protein
VGRAVYAKAEASGRDEELRGRLAQPHYAERVEVYPMHTDPESSLLGAQKAWEERYHAEHSQLTVGEIDAVRNLLRRLTEQIERDATGPSTLPQSLPEDGS